MWKLEGDCLVNVGCIMFLLYMGVYVDVLLYYCVDGVVIGYVLLDVYFGICCVIYCVGVVCVELEYVCEVLIDILLCVLLCMYVYML